MCVICERGYKYFVNIEDLIVNLAIIYHDDEAG